MRTEVSQRTRSALSALVLTAILASCGKSASNAEPPPPTVPKCTSNACQVTVAYRNDGKPRLQFDGDSLTVQASNDILAKWGSKYDIGIDALIGTTTYLQAPAVRTEAKFAPAVAVIELGTNDARCLSAPNPFACGPTTPDYVSKGVTGRLQAFAHAFPDTTCVIFVVPDDHNPSWDPPQDKVIDTYERKHFAHLADWEAAYQPSYFSAPDQPHPNERGRQKMLDLIAGAMKRC